MPTLGFVPSTDAALLAWSLNFSTKLTATPVAYGMVAGQATQYASAHASYATSLAIANDPVTRTKPSIAAKDLSRATLRALASSFGRMVSANLTVSDSLKLGLGLTVRAQPQPIPAPSVAPAITVLNQTAWTVRISLVGESPTQALGGKRATGPRRGKPAGVSGATVLSYVGATPPSDMGAWKFEGNCSVTTVDIAFASTLPPGQRVWLTAFWFNNRKASGPACAPVGANLPGGTVTAIAA